MKIQQVAVFLQDLETGGMVGPHPGKALDTHAGQPNQAALHFVGRLVGEGDGQNLFRWHARFHQVGEFGGQGAGFSRSGTGHHQGWGAGMFDSGLLLG
jgi:hypothetical protein